MKKTYCAEMAPQPLFTLFTSSKPQKRNLYRVHQHTELELGWILRGEGEYILDGASYDAQPGDLFLVRGNEQHCIPTIRTPTLDAFNIHLTVPYLWGTAADYADPARLRRLVGTGDVPHRFRGDAVLNGLLTQLMDSAQSDAPESRHPARAGADRRPLHRAAHPRPDGARSPAQPLALFGRIQVRHRHRAVRICAPPAHRARRPPAAHHRRYRPRRRAGLRLPQPRQLQQAVQKDHRRRAQRPAETRLTALRFDFQIRPNQILGEFLSIQAKIVWIFMRSPCNCIHKLFLPRFFRRFHLFFSNFLGKVLCNAT